MVHCCVLGCNSDSDTKTGGSSFHSFPSFSEPEMKQWVAATGRKNWIPKKGSRICNIHFPSSLVIKKGRKTYLHSRAVPTKVATMDESTIDFCEDRSNMVSNYIWDYKKGFSQKMPIDGVVKNNHSGTSQTNCYAGTSKNIQDIQPTATMQDSNGTRFLTIEPLRILDHRSSTESINEQSTENPDAQLDETNSGEEIPRKRKRQSSDTPQDEFSQISHETPQFDDECETITKLWAKKLRKLPEDRRDELIYKINNLVYKECVEYHRQSEDVLDAPVQVKEESTSECYCEDLPKSDEESNGFISVKAEPEDS